MSKRPLPEPKLVLSNGRLTREYWMLCEGLLQGLRRQWEPGLKGYNWRDNRSMRWLVERGYVESSLGPRGKSTEYRTTGDGAFAMAVAKGFHHHKLQLIAEQKEKRERLGLPPRVSRVSRAKPKATIEVFVL